MITMSSAMQRPSKKSLIILSLWFTVLSFAGCAALRLTYNNAPDLTYWWADNYLDFEGAQSDRVKADLAAWFRWHRAEQLPGYAQQLALAAQQVAEPTTPEKVCHWLDEINARAVPAFEHALPQLAELALTVTPKQLQHMAKRFEKNNDKFKDDYLQSDREDRLEANLERYEERAEMLYGRLQPAQRERLRQQLMASPYDADVWFAERRARQQDVLQTLRRLHAERATAAQAQTALRTLFVSFRQSPRPVYRAYNDRLMPYNCKLAAELHNSSTREQRVVAAKKLRGWQEDLRVLAAIAPQ
jgi:hypothetical protein